MVPLYLPFLPTTYYWCNKTSISSQASKRTHTSLWLSCKSVENVLIQWEGAEDVRYSVRADSKEDIIQTKEMDEQQTTNVKRTTSSDMIQPRDDLRIN